MKQHRYNRYHEPRRYGAPRHRRSKHSSSVGGYIVAAILMGVTVGSAWSVAAPEGRQAFMANAKDIAVSVGMIRERAPQEGDYWRGCDDARAAGTAPIYRGSRATAKVWTATTTGLLANPTVEVAMQALSAVEMIPVKLPLHEHVGIATF